MSILRTAVTNLRTLPDTIPELSLHKVLSAKQADGGYAVTLDCQHTIWSATDPGKRMHCGACAWSFIEKIRKNRITNSKETR